MSKKIIPYIIMPTDITADKIGAACTVAEDPTAVWAAGTYTLGQEVHVVETHRVYKCAIAGASAARPDLDTEGRWKDMRPTNKMAPFDIYTSTASTLTTGDIVYPITARFCNAVALYGLAGGSYEVTVKDVAGGAVIFYQTGRLRDRSRGWYDYLFGQRRALTKVLITGIPIRPAAEITVAIRSTVAGATRSVGMIVFGKIKLLIGSSNFGGTQKGVSVEPVTYSYIDTAQDGTLTIMRRHKATDMHFVVRCHPSQADNVLALLQDVLDKPVSVIAADGQGFRGPNVFGIIKRAPVIYSGKEPASIDMTVKGII